MNEAVGDKRGEREERAGDEAKPAHHKPVLEAEIIQLRAMLERNKADLERNKAELGRLQQYERPPRYDPDPSLAGVAVRSALALNGAAAIAVLIFIGLRTEAVPAELAAAVEVYAWGAFLAVVAAGAAFLAQVAVRGSNAFVAALPFRLAASALFATSLAAFAYGTWRAAPALAALSIVDNIRF